MAGKRTGRAPDPVTAALGRVALLAQQDTAPDRVAREVDAIVATWRDGDVDQAELRERLEEMHGQMVEAAQDAEQQVGDLDQSDAAAVRQASRSQAALEATRDALQAELGRLTCRP